MAQKNCDYAGMDADAFANFLAIESMVPGVSAEAGLLVRLTDKFKRLGNLLNRPPSVKDERFEDTCEDAINYLAILKELRKRRSCMPTSVPSALSSEKRPITFRGVLLYPPGT